MNCTTKPFPANAVRYMGNDEELWPLTGMYGTSKCFDHCYILSTPEGGPLRIKKGQWLVRFMGGKKLKGFTDDQFKEKFNMVDENEQVSEVGV